MPYRSVQETHMAHCNRQMIPLNCLILMSDYMYIMHISALCLRETLWAITSASLDHQLSSEIICGLFLKAWWSNQNGHTCSETPNKDLECKTKSNDKMATWLTGSGPSQYESINQHKVAINM